MTRIKPQTIETIETFRDRCDVVAKLDLQMDRIANNRDVAVAEIQQLHNREIDGLKAQRDHIAAQAAAYAERHRDVLIPKGKSGDTPCAIFGFRKSSKLKLLKPVAEIIEILKANLMTRYYKEEPKLDRAALKADRPRRASLADLCEIQDIDVFYIQPKPELAEPARA